MPRARWWVIGALSVVTVVVVSLDASGVIFTETPEPVPPPPVAVPQLPDAATALPAAVEPGPVAADPQVVRRVERTLNSDSLGSSVHAVVAPLADPTDAWVDLAGDKLATPASTLKLWTASALLDNVSADERLSTLAYWDPASGSVTLVGGGDATLETDPEPGSTVASLADLAKQTAKNVRRIGGDPVSIRLRYDASLFTGPSVAPQWEPTYVSSGVVAPVTALMVDQGRIDPSSDARLARPDAGAARRFGQLLEAEGLTLKGRASSVELADEIGSSDVVGEVASPPIGDLVERMLRDSDNQLAESLGRIAASKVDEPASFSGAVQAIRKAAQSRGVDLSDADLYDASGLSRDDALPPQTLVDALHEASADPQMAAILSGLAVAGFDGTLVDRFVIGPAADAAGLVRAKTGTLTGISAEAGIVTTCDGGIVAYAFVADEVVDTEAARTVLDEAAAELATCPGAP